MRTYNAVALALIISGAVHAEDTALVKPDTFGEDVAYLQRHTDVVVLGGEGSEAKVAVVGAYQGRVMTSTAAGNDGASFGWINYEAVAQAEFQPHINVYGGEDRFWMGPEGGQFSIFFKKDDPFDLEHWQTPLFIDTEPFELARRSDTSATYKKTAKLTNKSDTKFDIQVERTVRLLDAAGIKGVIGMDPPRQVKAVAYETVNKVTNQGRAAWSKDTGLLSIWILGMFRHGPETTVAIPFVTGPESKLGPVVNDTYFGKVPADRLKVEEGILFFKADGAYRSKIGLTPRRAKPFAGSYDAAAGALTLVHFTKPDGVTDYVNSMWEMQEQPFAGDAVNSYNDGPPAPGEEPFGPFYELETSSPALALKPGASATHVHRTFHFTGPEDALNAIARATLEVSLPRIKEAF